MSRGNKLHDSTIYRHFWGSHERAPSHRCSNWPRREALIFVGDVEKGWLLFRYEGKESRKMAASQHWLAICKSGEGSELKPNSHGEADFARIAWWESQRRDWLAVCVALSAPLCSAPSLCGRGVRPQRSAERQWRGPRLSPFGQDSASMGQRRVRGAQCQLRSRHSPLGRPREVPGRTSLGSSTNLPIRVRALAPGTTHTGTQSPRSHPPPGCNACMGWHITACPGLPFLALFPSASPKQPQDTNFTT